MDGKQKMKRSEFMRIKEAISRGEEAWLEVQSDGSRYVRKFDSGERLIILGGGHVSQPTCRIAAMLDFEVVVDDDRPAFANYGNFPDASSIVCDEFRKAIRDLKIAGSGGSERVWIDMTNEAAAEEGMACGARWRS